jgi:hypothetical protein
MKRVTIKLTLIFCAISLLAYSCGESETKSTEEVLTYLAGNMDSSQGCEIPFVEDSSGNTLAYRMRDTCAMNAIRGYKDSIDLVKNLLQSQDSANYTNVDETLIYGIGIDMREIKRIINASRFSSNDSLYVMMGIMPSGGTGMIFALESQEQATSNKEWQYFDFTRPCPNSCPGWFPALGTTN